MSMSMSVCVFTFVHRFEMLPLFAGLTWIGLEALMPMSSLMHSAPLGTTCEYILYCLTSSQRFYQRIPVHMHLL